MSWLTWVTTQGCTEVRCSHHGVCLHFSTGFTSVSSWFACCRWSLIALGLYSTPLKFLERVAFSQELLELGPLPILELVSEIEA